MKTNIKITKRLQGYDFTIDRKDYFNVQLKELVALTRVYI